jgi:hypothetical protein
MRIKPLLIIIIAVIILIAIIIYFGVSAYKKQLELPDGTSLVQPVEFYHKHRDATIAYL